MESMSYSVRKPVGVVGMVTPWNLPLYLFTWKLGPALAMGNSVVVKPSELTPTTATMLAELCEDAGMPKGTVNVVHGQGHVAGHALVAHPDVAAVSFTGGTATGASVAAIAAPHFKKLSLELGGKNAAIVFDDCSFEETVAGVVRSSFLNSGQICLCSSRILIQRGEKNDFYERFVDAFVAAAKKLVVSSPNDRDADLGPVSSQAHLTKIQNAISEAQRQGGKVLCGGGRPERIGFSGGFYIEPVVIAGLGSESNIFQNEVFGPVVTVHGFDTEDEAVELANATRYGLAATLWSESMKRAELAERLDAGTVWVNTWLNRELHMPFGGVRDSGVNREGGTHSLDFYSEASTVCIKRGARTPLPMPGRGSSLSKGSKSATNGLGTNLRRFSTLTGMVAGAPKPLGAYVHARRAGEFVFLSGIGPRDPETNQVPGGPILDPESGQVRDYDMEAQTSQCFSNVKRILEGVGCKLSDVVDVQAYLVNMKRDFPAFNKTWEKEMCDISACRTTIEVADLPPGGRIAVEMKVVALANPRVAFK
jgi:aminomuconate-semialdehyde/2-hydroxymuconate-6-semialdehyde dehydrogenase